VGPGDIGGQFEPFGTSHLVMIGVFVAGLWPAYVVGRRARRDPARMSRTFAVLLVAFVLPLQVIDHLPGRFELEVTLPLQLCDLAAVAAAVALWTRRRTPVALTYYWGLALTPQALLTPALVNDFPDPRFIAFWGMHILIVWAAVYLTWGLRITPTWRGFRIAVLVTAVWMILMFPLNLLLGTNYGFVNAKPATGSVLDLFGPWPLYLVVEVVIVAAVWALMTWPWARRGPGQGALPPPRSGTRAA
jgi:hypothetical integral membrane protein (TIGR02206 family)